MLLCCLSNQLEEKINYPGPGIVNRRKGKGSITWIHIKIVDGYNPSVCELSLIGDQREKTPYLRC